ncbi:glycoside hydrolase 5 family protein [Glaciibacter psychrotolerans]|uniref:Glycosyl hydrolase n=2 Tax=Glaciibacter psychrotolerans TaxID=670054 RepID=A0A7Z0EE24_9MICO|nr:hypothetical protein [Leifsonia psychrotolerans]
MAELPSPRLAADTSLRFGVNYTPAHEWMHSWLALDLDRVRRDFSSIAELGLDHVRIFPLWPILQPNRALIRAEAIADVRAVVDIAAELGLDTSVDAIQGHLSSFDFLPSWLSSWHTRNMFTDPEVLEAEVRLVQALGAALADAPNFMGLTLGNEVNQFADRPHPTPMPTTIVEAEKWLTVLLNAAVSAAPNATHVHSEYDAVWYLDGHPFTPPQASRLGRMTTIHSWIFNGTAQKYGGRSVAADRHAEYLIELSRAFATNHRRPIWLQEVGAPSNCLTEAETHGFLEATVRSVASTQNLWGVTWWCSHDVSRSLVDFPELEYTLGLFDNAGRVKPAGRVFGELARELSGARPEVPARPTAIVIPVDEHDIPIQRAALSPGGAVFEAWLGAIRSGLNPSFVLSSQARDAAVLADRGISDVIDAGDDPRFVGRYSAVNTVTG